MLDEHPQWLDALRAWPSAPIMQRVMASLRGFGSLDLGGCAPVRSTIYPKSKTVATKPVSEQQLDPESLVARIVEELRANPAAQRLLLRTLLTNEFLGMPARLQHIERDIAELNSDVAELKSDDVAELKNDVGQLKGSDLEMKVHRRIRPLLSQHLGLRRARIVQSAVHQAPDDFAAVTRTPSGSRSRSRIGSTEPTFSAGPMGSRRFTIGPSAPQDSSTQLSMVRFGTRANSSTLPVTSVAPNARA